MKKTILNCAAAYNLSGGFAIVFFLDALAPLVGLPLGMNMLFRHFVGGTAVIFGVAYSQLARSGNHGSPLLMYGTTLKYWAFVASLFSYWKFGLSVTMVLLFGVPYLIFAVLFTRMLLSTSEKGTG